MQDVTATTARRIWPVGMRFRRRRAPVPGARRDPSPDDRSPRQVAATGQVAPEGTAPPDGVDRASLSRKIIVSNLLAILLVIGGVLYAQPFRDGLVAQRQLGLIDQSQLVAQIVEARLRDAGAGGLEPGPGGAAILADLRIPGAVDILVFDAASDLVAKSVGRERPGGARTFAEVAGEAPITTHVMRVWTALVGSSGDPTPGPGARAAQARALVAPALGGEVVSSFAHSSDRIFTAAAPVHLRGEAVGAVAVVSAAGEIDRLVQIQREQVLQFFAISIIVSIGLSLVLASTIATPLADLARAAEIGGERTSRRMRPGRVPIPDLTARGDEIGRLSGALRSMVSALYDRIEANEQFAADVAHEIKNPLASLKSAVGTLRSADRADHRATLLGVIEHDVRRLDRLVSDISNASRLDSELVRGQEARFDLTRLLSDLGIHLAREAGAGGVTLVTDLPPAPIEVVGLESRLAQVIVNLVGNAVSFCQPGDAIRLWARRRGDRVLVVVEDTGPGIPEAALCKIFQRFYSERPEGQFGDNSGLGLAISRQIVEAHGGVIWAENIRPTTADLGSDALGARFVVGLPL